jgi:hypothetical protein
MLPLLGLLAGQGLAAPNDVAQVAPPRPDPVARVGERPIARRALDLAVQAALGPMVQFHRVSPARERSQARTELDGLIRRELDILGGLDRGLVPDVLEAERERAKMEASLAPGEYATSMKALGWNADRHARTLAESTLGKTAYRRFVQEPSAPSDDEVRAAFAANPKKYEVQEMVQVSHILVRAPEAPTAEDWKKLEARADALLERLRKGEPFDEVAANSSDDMYRIKGGDLGWVHRGRLIPVLDDAVFKAKPGALLGPIRSDEGLHIARVQGRKPGRTMGFQEAAPFVRRELGDRKLKAAEEKWYSDLRRRHPVVVLDPALREEAPRP